MEGRRINVVLRFELAVVVADDVKMSRGLRKMRRIK
jgi:hypothetical protein